MPDHPPKRLAVICTIYRYLSHAQHFTDRFLVGYPCGGHWHRPNMKVVSLYADQSPEGDQSRARAQEFGFEVYPSIAETLRCGGDALAGDGILIIAEHGEYPNNEKGQKQYPRYEMFKQCVEVFEQDAAAAASLGVPSSPSTAVSASGKGRGSTRAARIDWRTCEVCRMCSAV